MPRSHYVGCPGHRCGDTTIFQVRIPLVPCLGEPGGVCPCRCGYTPMWHPCPLNPPMAASCMAHPQGQPDVSPCSLWLQGAGRKVTAVEAWWPYNGNSPLPPQASPVPLMVTATPRDNACSRSAVLILLCARCSATITSPCSNLIICTVSATAHREQSRGQQGWGHRWGCLRVSLVPLITRHDACGAPGRRGRS